MTTKLSHIAWFVKKRRRADRALSISPPHACECPSFRSRRKAFAASRSPHVDYLIECEGKTALRIRVRRTPVSSCSGRLPVPAGSVPCRRFHEIDHELVHFARMLPEHVVAGVVEGVELGALYH